MRFLLLVPVFFHESVSPQPQSIPPFFENSRRYSQVKVHHRYQRHRRQIFPPVSLVLLIPVANLPPVSTMPVANCRQYQLHRWQTMRTVIKLLTTDSTTQRCPKEIIKKFWWKIFHICHWCKQHRSCTLSCEYLREFSKKFETALMEWGKLIYEKNQKQKISDTVLLRRLEKKFCLVWA